MSAKDKALEVYVTKTEQLLIEGEPNILGLSTDTLTLVFNNKVIKCKSLVDNQVRQQVILWKILSVPEFTCISDNTKKSFVPLSCEGIFYLKDTSSTIVSTPFSYNWSSKGLHTPIKFRDNTNNWVDAMITINGGLTTNTCPITVMANNQNIDVLGYYLIGQVTAQFSE